MKVLFDEGIQRVVLPLPSRLPCPSGPKEYRREPSQNKSSDQPRCCTEPEKEPSNWNDLSSADSDKLIKGFTAMRDEQRAKFKWKCVTKEPKKTILN